MATRPTALRFDFPLLGNFKDVLDYRTVAHAADGWPDANGTAKGMLRVVFDDADSTSYQVYINVDGLVTGWQPLSVERHLIAHVEDAVITLKTGTFDTSVRVIPTLGVGEDYGLVHPGLNSTTNGFNLMNIANDFVCARMYESYGSGVIVAKGGAYPAGTTSGYAYAAGTNAGKFAYLDGRYGHIYATGLVAGGQALSSSDDRCKFNEIAVSDGLAVVRQLAPTTYDKSQTFEATDLRKEIGFIAQEVQQIAQLSHTVKGFPNLDGDDEILALDYNQILTYTVAAVKELDVTIQALAARVATLEQA